MRELKHLVLTLALALAASWGVSQARATTTFTIGNGGLETFNLTWDGHTENALAGGILLTRTVGHTPEFRERLYGHRRHRLPWPKLYILRADSL